MNATTFMDMNASVPAGTFINEHTPALMTTIMRVSLRGLEEVNRIIRVIRFELMITTWKVEVIPT